MVISRRTTGTPLWVLALVALAGCASPPEQMPAPEPDLPPRISASETRGFVVSRLSGIPQVGTTGCPDGLNRTEREQYGIDTQELKAKIEELGRAGAEKLLYPPDTCRDPRGHSDPGFRTFDGPAIIVGLDLDGKISLESDSGGCAHDDFSGPNGESGIDNQYWRLVGCTAGYRPGGLIDRAFENNNYVREGFPILIEVDGIEDPRNDDAVSVRFFSSRDPVTLDATDGVTPGSSLGVLEEPRFWSDSAPGRIENGVLTTEPVDVLLRFKQQVIDGEVYYRDTRLRAELLPDGGLRGVLGFYRDTGRLFAHMNDHYIGKYHTGRSAADARGYICGGMYYALERLADGHPDPATGRCTSVSAALEFEAVPAFLIHPES